MSALLESTITGVDFGAASSRNLHLLRTEWAATRLPAERGLRPPRRRASAHVPRLFEDAEVDPHLLGAMADGRSLGDIARGELTRFPGRFSRFQAALDHVADLSVRYKS